MIIVLIIFFLITLIVLTMKNIESFSNDYNSIDSSLTDLLVDFTCINPKKIEIDGQELKYSVDNFKKAQDYCIKNNFKAFMLQDGVFKYSNNILKLKPGSGIQYKSWVVNSDILDSSITIESKNVGINTKPDRNYYLDVNGSMVIETDNNKKGVICLKDDKGVECLSKQDIYNINKAPLAFNSNRVLCLKDDNGTPVCINEFELGMLAGTSKFKLRNIDLEDYNANNYISKGKVKISGGMATLSEITKPPTELQECVGDYGTKYDDPICCGQPGLIKDPESEFICKNPDFPKCSGYVQDKIWGICEVDPHIYAPPYSANQEIDVYYFKEGANNDDVQDFFINLKNPPSLDNTIPLLNYKYNE